MTRVQVDKRSDVFPSAVFIDSVSVMGRIQKEFFNAEFREICFHSEKGMEKGKHIMPGSPLQKRKYGEVTVGIGSHIHVEVVTEEIAFPVGVPTPVAVRLGIMPFTVTGRTALFFTVTDPFFSLLGCSPYRGAVTGKCQMVRIDQSLVDRKLQELLSVETENKRKGVFRFQLPMFQHGEEFGSCAGRVAGSLIAFLFPFRRLHFREAVFGREVVLIILPNAGEEIIKSTNAWGIAEGETAEDGIKRSFLKHAAPDSDGSNFQFQSKQVGAQHAGRKPGLGTKNRIAILHDGIGL